MMHGGKAGRPIITGRFSKYGPEARARAHRRHVKRQTELLATALRNTLHTAIPTILLAIDQRASQRTVDHVQRADDAILNELTRTSYQLALAAMTWFSEHMTTRSDHTRTP